MKNSSKTWFITGTDTEIGKTFVTSKLLRTLNQHRYFANGYKPIASGSVMTQEGLRNPDALAHLQASYDDLSYEMINPYFFEEEEAPHILAERHQHPIEFSKINQGLAYLQSFHHITLVEGAGGWHTPLNKKERYSDWVIANNLPVIVVVGLKLGIINHALLTFETIARSGLKIDGWIANHLSDNSSLQNYIEGIKQFSDVPMIGEVPFQLSDQDQDKDECCFDLRIFKE